MPVALLGRRGGIERIKFAAPPPLPTAFSGRQKAAPSPLAGMARCAAPVGRRVVGGSRPVFPWPCLPWLALVLLFGGCGIGPGTPPMRAAVAQASSGDLAALQALSSSW